MITASLRVRLPDATWVADVSREFPDATFRLLAGVRTGETAVELGEIRAADPGAVAEAISAHPSIVSTERLVVTDDRLLARYETTDTGLYAFLAASSVPPEFPIVVENGRYDLEFTGTRDALDRLCGAFDERGRAYDLRSVVETERAGSVVTDRQREVLEAALRAGYFEVPRACTLDELATELEIDKSTASEILRRGERRILTTALTGADG